MALSRAITTAIFRFPVSHLNVRKAVSIIALSAVGGRGSVFGHFLLLAGGVCLAIALLVLGIEFVCKRKRGDARFRKTIHRETVSDESDEDLTTSSEEGERS